MDDIEDSQSLSVKPCVWEEDKVVVHSKNANSFTVHFKTYGCQHNVSDSEVMAGILVERGFSLTDRIEEADVVVLNSCTVKGTSQDKFIHAARQARLRGQYVVVTGCVPEAMAHDKEDFPPPLNECAVLGIRQFPQIAVAVEALLSGERVVILGDVKEHTPASTGLGISKTRVNSLIEIVPISQGCLNHCTYCKTKSARGNLRSFPPKYICDCVRKALGEGVKEIRLTSEDVGAYGIDIGTTIAALLQQLTAILEEHPAAMLRIGMTNPPYIAAHIEAVAAVLNHPQVYSFLHIPVQSGSDAVLADMNRQYSCDDFRDIVDELKAHVPQITLATDVICGYPTESETDFEDTLDLLRDYHFPIVNISQMFQRPNTPAARLTPLPAAERKRRTKMVTELFESYHPFKSLVDSTEMVWVAERATDGKHLVGHTKNYVQVLVDPECVGLGQRALAKIVSASKYSVKADVLKVLED
eukprot:GCRY01002130.1.p1 GENE.GCRY01002130.1~~GCRY01002130.1.p1  ORF type:complete len:471 (+),score=111.85 GCRY01002130.1:180-1592(+)